MFVLPLQRKSRFGSIAFLLTLSLTAHTVAMAADGESGQNESAPRALLGKEIFETRCAVCHGVDGRGDPGRQMMRIELPDFADCSFASREPDSDFAAVIHGGGPARGFSVLMPAHGEVPSQVEVDNINSHLSGARKSGALFRRGLDRAEIASVLSYLRTFCSDERWPRGELNLPRPLLTEKAFPEDEAVVTTFANVNRSGFISTQLLFEKRIGPRAMVELELPVIAREWETTRGSKWYNGIGDLVIGDERGIVGDSEWYGGVGDFAIGTKYAFFHSIERGSIASVGAEVKVPTGNEDHGLGKGSVVFEPFLAAAQILPGDSFVQMQLLGEIPTSGGSEIYLRSALGKTFVPRLHGRGWTPMVEVLVIGVMDLGGSVEVNLDIVPQIQVPLNRRQHVLLNVGVWITATRNDKRATRVGAYLLWDWFDGGLLDGW